MRKDIDMDNCTFFVAPADVTNVAQKRAEPLASLLNLPDTALIRLLVLNPRTVKRFSGQSD